MKAFEKDVSQMLHGTGFFTYIYHKAKGGYVYQPHGAYGYGGMAATGRLPVK